VALLLLAGCAQMPAPTTGGEPASPTRFHLEGRVSVKSEEQSFSGRIRWKHDAVRDEILLSSPLGQGVAQLRQEGGRVTLESAEGRTYVADSGEALLDSVLGVRLPIDGMMHWLLAQPRPGAPFELEQNGEGRVARLHQDGWRLEYGRYQVHGERWLPGRIFARRDEALEFRLVVDAWQTD
jgi:outer membrane lipoprotein LolB